MVARGCAVAAFGVSVVRASDASGDVVSACVGEGCCRMPFCGAGCAVALCEERGGGCLLQRVDWLQRLAVVVDAVVFVDEIHDCRRL